MDTSSTAARVCAHCGAPLVPLDGTPPPDPREARRCDRCGAEVPPDALESHPLVGGGAASPGGSGSEKGDG